MIIYGEMLFIENAVIGAVLLYLTGNICGMTFGGKTAKARLLAGSLMCGVFSLVIFLNAKGWIMILMEFFFAAAVCAVVFGLQGRHFSKSMRSFVLRRIIVFILITYFMGGITMGLLLLVQQQGIYTAAGIYTGDMKAAMLTIFIMLGYMTVKQTAKTIRTIKLYEEHSYQIKLRSGERELTARGFLDTGNHLRDPVSGKPVSVASEGLWEKMKTGGLVSENKFTLIPYETVGGKGLLEAVRMSHAELAAEPIMGRQPGGTMKIDGFIIARNSEDFHIGEKKKLSEGCGYDLLLSSHIKGSIF